MDRNEFLLNETRNRMKHLYEYSFFRNGVMEDDQNNDGGMPGGDPGMGGDPNAMGGGMPGGDPGMGGDPNAMGGDPNAMGGDPNGMGGGVDGANLAPNAGMDGGDPNAMGGDPNGMGMDPIGGDPNGMGMDPMGGDPNGMGMDPMGGDPNGMGMGGQPGPDDDVVDITALTDAQDQMQQTQQQMADQMSDVDEKLATLMQVLDKFTRAIDANDQKISDLQRELIKRTPTEEETMNVRLNAGGNPFDQKPEEFWNKFQDINNHYNITSNNDAPQYQIKKSDIDNFNDKMIADEFDDIPTSLKEYFIR